MIKKYLNLILIIFVFAILLIGLVNSKNTEEHLFYYWIPYIWLSFLVLLNWLVASQILHSDESKNPLFGVLPVAGIVLTASSLISSVLMFYNASEQALFSTFHSVTQILIISITSIIILMFGLISKIAEVRTEKGSILKNDSIKIINLLMTESSLDITKNLKKIIDLIEYELPHDSKLQLDDNWKKFSNKLLLVQNKDDKYELSIGESQNWIKIIESLK